MAASTIDTAMAGGVAIKCGTRIDFGYTGVAGDALRLTYPGYSS